MIDGLMNKFEERYMNKLENGHLDWRNHWSIDSFIEKNIL